MNDFYVAVDMHGLEIQNHRLHMIAGDLATPHEGDIWYNTSTSDPMVMVSKGSTDANRSLIADDDDFHARNNAVVTIQDADEFLIWDDSVSPVDHQGQYRRITRANLFNGISTILDAYNEILVDSGTSPLTASGEDQFRIAADGNILETVGSSPGGINQVTLTLLTQTTNYVLAGPSTGGAAIPTFRALVDADMPTSYSSGDWDTAYTHSQITSGNPHGVTFTQYWSRNTSGTPFIYPTTTADHIHADVFDEYTTDAGVTIESVLLKDGKMSLDYLGNPTQNNSISMANFTHTWLFASPAGGMLYNFVGAASGHLVEMIQQTGAPSAGTHLLHIQAASSNVDLLHLQHGASTSRVLEVDVSGDANYRFIMDATGRMDWGDGTAVQDTYIYRNGNDLTFKDNTTGPHTLSALIASAGTTFLGLTDTPSAYTSSAGFMVMVGAGAPPTALVFTDPSTYPINNFSGTLTGNWTVTGSNSYKWRVQSVHASTGSVYAEFSDNGKSFNAVSWSADDYTGNYGSIYIDDAEVNLVLDNSVNQKKIAFTVSAMTVTDTISSLGFQYAADYSTAGKSFGARWIPDWGATSTQLGGNTVHTTITGPTVTEDGMVVFWDNSNSRFDLKAAAGGGTHAFLSATHTDTTTSTVVRGDIIIGNSTPNWTRLAISATTTHLLRTDGTDVSWGAFNFADLGTTPTTFAGYGISDTLANLNTAITDATLIDTGDSRLSDDRDPNAHVLAGADHTASGLTVGEVIAADTATTFSWRTLLGSEISNDLGWTTNAIIVNNQADNRVITATATTDTLYAESNLTYNGTLLLVSGSTVTVDMGQNGYIDFTKTSSVASWARGIRFYSYLDAETLGMYAYGADRGSVDYITIGESHTDELAKFIRNGAVELYFSNSKKFETVTGGTTTTGIATVNSTGNDIGIFKSTSLTYARIRVDAGAAADTMISWMENNSSKASMGWDVGTSSARIVEGQGVLDTRETMAAFYPNGQFELYHNNTKVLYSTDTDDLRLDSHLGIGLDPDASYSIYANEDIMVEKNDTAMLEMTIYNTNSLGAPHVQYKLKNIGKEAAFQMTSDGHVYLRAITDGVYLIGMSTSSSDNLVIGCDPVTYASSTSLVTSRTDIANGYVYHFFNDGNNADRNGIKISAGADSQVSGVHYHLRAFTGNTTTEAGGLRNNGDTFQIYQGSDRRRKTEIFNTRIDAAGILANLKVRDYRRVNNDQVSKIQTGWIAQEVMGIFPAMHAYNEDSDLHTVAPTELIPILHRGWQIHETEISKLKRKVKSLEKRIKELEA